MKGLVIIALLGCLISYGSAAPPPLFLAYQDSLGQYSFGYSDPTSARSEYRTSDGVTHGTYSFIDENGKIQTTEYEAGGDFGFRVKATNLPQAPLPVQDTPEVSAAREKHLKLLEEARRREMNELLRQSDAAAPVAEGSKTVSVAVPVPVSKSDGLSQDNAALSTIGGIPAVEGSHEKNSKLEVRSTEISSTSIASNLPLSSATPTANSLTASSALSNSSTQLPNSSALPTPPTLPDSSAIPTYPAQPLSAQRPESSAQPIPATFAGSPALPAPALPLSAELSIPLAQSLSGALPAPSAHPMPIYSALPQSVSDNSGPAVVAQLTVPSALPILPGQSAPSAQLLSSVQSASSPLSTASAQPTSTPLPLPPAQPIPSTIPEISMQPLSQTAPKTSTQPKPSTIPEPIYTLEVMAAREAHFRAYEKAARLAAETDANPQLLEQILSDQANVNAQALTIDNKPEESKISSTSIPFLENKEQPNYAEITAKDFEATDRRTESLGGNSLSTINNTAERLQAIDTPERTQNFQFGPDATLTAKTALNVMQSEQMKSKTDRHLIITNPLELVPYSAMDSQSMPQQPFTKNWAFQYIYLQ